MGEGSRQDGQIWGSLWATTSRAVDLLSERSCTGCQIVEVRIQLVTSLLLFNLGKGNTFHGSLRAIATTNPAWWQNRAPRSEACPGRVHYTPLRTLIKIVLLISSWALYKQKENLIPKGDIVQGR